MSKRIDPKVRVIYGRLWHYVTPHKLIGFIAVIGMASTAVIEAGLVALLQPLTDEALVAKNLETAKWIPFAFMGIFVLRGISGFATEASLGWIGRRVISDLRRQVFNKFLTLPARFFDSQTAGPLLSRMTYNVEMVAESVTSVVTIAVRDVLTVLAEFHGLAEVGAAVHPRQETFDDVPSPQVQTRDPFDRLRMQKSFGIGHRVLTRLPLWV